MLARSLNVGVSMFAVGYALVACNAPPFAPHAATSRADRDVDAALAGVFDGDSIVNIGDVYDVAQHFTFGV